MLNCNISIQTFLLFYGLCNNCRPLGRVCGKCDTSKDRAGKVKDRLAQVQVVNLAWSSFETKRNKRFFPFHLSKSFKNFVLRVLSRYFFAAKESLLRTVLKRA